MITASPAFWIGVACLLAGIASAAPKKGHRDEGISPFVIGGDDAARKQFPEIASLQIRDQHVCGGSIIDKSWILTAAHCVEDWSPEEMTILVGTTDHADQSRGVRRQVAKFIIHGDYSYTEPGHGPFLMHDIALIELAEPVPVSKKVRLASLQSSKPGDKDKATVAGWGQTTNDNLDMSKKLQYAHLEIVGKERCQEEIGVTATITDDQICATYTGEETQAHCSGDSGGPLFSHGHQVGIVSWASEPCGLIPGVYSSVAAHLDWIRENTGLQNL